MVSLVPNGEQTFVDINGDPLSGGKVYFYVPGTTNPSNTFADPDGTVVNPNPVVLNQAGRAIIWGNGKYRQVVQDQFGSTQWDAETDAGAAAGGTIQGNLNVTQNLTVGGNTTTDTLTVNNGSTLNGGATVNGGLTVNGTSAVNGDENVSGTLTAGNINTGGALGVGGNITSTGLTVNGETSLNGDLFVSGSVTIPNTLTANVLEANGNRIISRGFSSPSVVCFNQADSVAMGMWCASDKLEFGGADGGGNPAASFLNIDTSGNVYPTSSNATYCGLAANAWAGVESFAFITATSSATVKEDIEPLEAARCMRAVEDLTPVSFKYKVEDGKVHSGFIAEEVLKAIEEAELKSGAVIKRDVMGLVYNELIPILWGAVKGLRIEVEDLRGKLLALEEKPADV